MKQTISEQIVASQTAIDNALNHTEIQKKMAGFGYDRKKLMEGNALCQKVRMLNFSKQSKYSEQLRSTDTFQADLLQVDKSYKKHLKIARVAFENDRATSEALQIRGKRKTDTHGWLEQAYAFYYAIDAYTEVMSRYNVSQEELMQTRAMVEALYSTRQQQIQSKGESQQATFVRDQARKELKAYMSRFRKTARIALMDNPQLLEVLGIVIRTKV